MRHNRSLARLTGRKLSGRSGGLDIDTVLGEVRQTLVRGPLLVERLLQHNGRAFVSHLIGISTHGSVCSDLIVFYALAGRDNRSVANGGSCISFDVFIALFEQT